MRLFERQFLKTTPIYSIYKALGLDRVAYRRGLIDEVRRWERNGRTGWAPRLYKQRTVRDYGRRFGVNTLIETGTCKGEMVEACRKAYRHIVSIELEDTLFARAVERFAPYPHVEILHGDSAEVLPRVLERLNERCVFWLDGHYTDEGTAKGVLETPIVQELDAILGHHVTNHILLIDDAREFNGTHDYPLLSDLRTYLLSRRPGWVLDVRDDIIRCHEAV